MVLALWLTKLGVKVRIVDKSAELGSCIANSTSPTRYSSAVRNLGYNNVSVKVGDGYHGWPECGPFNAIIVTAALEHVPPPLIEQLKVGGRLVMPLGPAHATQQLTVVEKIAAGKTKTSPVVLVRFVPFTRSPD